MITLCQQNPAWAKFKIGESNLTLGQYGCTTCCLSMLSDYFRCYKDPVAIQQFQQYTPDGLIKWETLHLGPMKFDKRLYGRHDDEIKESLRNPKKGVMLEVNHSHWVVATGKVPLTNTYFIRDPWRGDKSTTLRYKNNITGSAHYYVN